MSKFGRKIKQAPAGYEYIEPTITALENELRESKSTLPPSIRLNCSRSFLLQELMNHMKV